MRRGKGTFPFLIFIFTILVLSCSKERERSHSDKDFERVGVAVRQQKPEARAMVDSALAVARDSMTYYDYYFLLGNLYMVNAPDSALMCANHILQFAQRQEPSPRVNGIAGSAYNLRANYYYLYHQNADEVIKDNKEAYRLFMQSDIINNAPAICANIGDAYRQLNLLTDAASWYRRALVLADSINLPKGKRTSFYIGLGVTYYMLEDYDLSEECFAKSKENYDSMHTNMKMTYLNNYGNLQYYKKDYPKALSVFQQLDSLIDELNLRGGFEDYLCHINMADVLQNLGRTKESIEVLAPADSFFRAKGVGIGIYYANTIRIANALHMGDLGTATQIINTEPKALTQDENMLDIRNRYLHDYYVKTGNIRLADYYERLHQQRRDSIEKSQEHMRAKDIVARLTIDTLQLHNQLRIEEKNAVIQRNLLVSAVVVSIVLVIALALLVWTLYLRKRNADKEQEIANLKIATVRNSMSPHFIFNVLKHATTLDVHDAEDTIRSVIKLMHSQIDISREMFVPLRRELEFTQAYIDTAAMTMGDDFSFKLIAPEGEQLDECLVPSTFVQILVENAIKHGLRGLDRPKTLTVAIDNKEDMTTIEVTDNGRGFDVRNHNTRYSNEGTGTGLRVILNTINYYNSRHRDAILFDIDNVIDDKGETLGCRSMLSIDESQLKKEK
ncbi:MAG: histidine kinase [Prevotella sp.]|nr:histidine kinase [Prevotella sp.]